ncbi:MAG: hypothetical protein SangKO_014680 [Sandaracinaceae bacterium]
MFRSRFIFGVTLAVILTCALLPGHGRAYINQVDGTVLPVTNRLQLCLDSGNGEGMTGAVDAIADAAVIPEAYRPVFDAVSGRYRVTFVDIAEGAGFRNSFGWFWVGDDVSDPANLRTIFGCRTYGSCACGSCSTTRTITVDFDTQPGFSPGRPIGFWLRTPERLDGSREGGTFPSGCPFDAGCQPTGTNVNDSCGSRLDTNNRIYFTSSALNDDGDYVHFLVYRSITRTDTFYFGFEDLFRGGDNDFEDFLGRATGLVPICDPQPETCDNVDQDCDGAIDEGLTRGCATACGAGTETCSAGSYGSCSARVPDPTETRCDGGDDDCDGAIDEGLTRACSNMCGAGTEVCRAGMFADCSARAPTLESCNGGDDDCDGRVDEGLTRACGSACGSGTETCVAGSFGGCTAPSPGAETCDNTDEDCDGRTDEGLTRACSSMCGTGTEVCISGSFVGCTAPSGSVESCNGVDDDCDGAIDEGVTRACSTSCGVGTETCVAGAFVGCDAPTATPEVCNNVDDDCNGIIDDGNPGGGAACLPLDDGGFSETDGGVPDGGADFCLAGRVVCVGGELSCRGASGTTREICNCMDDDCDGVVDENAGGDLCPGGACVDCRCVSPCEDDEFPCPPGRECDRSFADPSMGIIGYCVAGMCADVECSDEEICNPTTGACEDLCAGVECGAGFACVRGTCVEDSCYGRGCPTGERCRMGACEADPCVGVSCDAGSYCREGACAAVCTRTCGEGQVCEDDTCVDAPCGGCASGESCVDDACAPDACAPTCGRGRVCEGDACVDDLCRGVRCPTGASCQPGGWCVLDEIVPPRDPDYGIATGGGCQCSATGSGGPSGLGGAALGLLLLSLLFLRRVRVPRSAPRGAGRALAGALVLFLGGCDVEPFCFDDCEGETDAGPRDAGRPDARPADGCVPTGEETCNETDDDCDGLVDEGFDTQTDPGNCGACGSECVLPFAFPGCMEGGCVIERCEIGHHDLDDTPANGCEYECPPSGAELCDGLDNDCDGAVDEDFDVTTDLEHCGTCGNTCGFANAAATCEASACVMGGCNTGFVDLNGDPGDGCEYACVAAGAESCNAVDDDCDGRIDEGFDLSTDPMNCGVCGRRCVFANATGACVPGGGGSVCGIGGCAAGFHDIDGDPATGCEYPCTATGRADACDGVDDDCDGRIDEADPTVGSSCGTSTGACSPGVNSCQRGAIVCVGGGGPQAETCDGVDQDCDGRTDEGALPGVGDRCGATNVGRCAFGTVACTSGSLSCGGGFVGPAAETCNGADDDCNGATDDGLTPPPRASVPSCAETRGVCAGRTPTCRGAGGWGCDLPASYQATETICDGLDNDCDGTADEGCLGPVGSDTRLDLGDTASQYNSLAPFILGDGGSRVWVSWMDLRLGDARVYFNRSTNGGSSWLSTPTRLDTAGGPAIGPRIALASPDDVSVVWADFRGGTSYREIYGRFSTDYGATFAASDVKVNASGSTATRDSFNVELASSGSNVYVVYESFVSDRSRQVFFSRSTNGGSSWSAPVQASSGTGSTYVAATPKVAAAGSDVYVVWRDNRSGGLDIFLRRSTNSGSSFTGGDVRLDVGDAAGSNSSFSPALAAQGANVYVAWVDDRDMGSFDIWLNRSQDRGASWRASALQLDADPFSHDSLEPHVVAPASGEAVVAWVDYRSGFPDVLAARTTDAGNSFSTPTRLDTGSASGTSGSVDLSLDARGSLVVAAWADDRAGLLDIYANFSLDGGASWQPQDYRLDSSPLGTSDSQRPRVYVSATAAHVVWVDHRLGSGCPGGSSSGMSCANGDIFYRRMQ